MSKPTEENTPELRPHVYDGIQEYDQKLPNWWLFTFYIAIAFFVIYWLAYYQFQLIPTDEERMHAAMAQIDAARLKQLESLDDAKLWAMAKDTKAIESGKATYTASCMACHGPTLAGGPGLPGLSLADKVWKHGGQPTEILKVIRKGSPDVSKGMPAWEPQLGLPRVLEVLAYVLSHHQEGETFKVDPNDKPSWMTATPAPATGAQ
ncbi:cbb3-type cytochrome c oxidase N-terminal domain-containing protein [Verrucomicrobium sp. BvORR106]|uniref:cbb3-type cytochrome c oxidase N-terminal domain-containing protein n=1 Tax=Verrucomicrobium sp. BvORR106 TaxID=1403819 RepID=UPI00068C17F8|nr:cbb3-type cytochrome c oxidase N-terminal domain-containing protein [Verrucomicrobium sp. BvORR106]